MQNMGHRAGLAASVITYSRRSAFREVAKVFGLSRDVQAALSSEVWGRESKVSQRSRW